MTMMMADHGADVIMVEPANGTGEPTRAIGQKTEEGVSVWFRNIARGKRSLRLNLKDPRGQSLFHALAKETDVVVEAFRPRVVRRLGVDYETLREINPRLVYCSISAFGQTSSLAQKPSHDTGVQALTGLIDLNRGLTDDKPSMPAVPFADAAASLMALSAILMALYRRETTGQGDYIDMAMYDAAIAWTPNVTGPVFADDAHPSPKDMRSFGGSALTNLYETADGQFLAFTGPELKFATNLLTALERPDLIEIAKLEPGRAQAPLREFLAETFRGQPLSYWQTFLEPIDCGWSWVRTLKDAFDDPFTAERGMVVTAPDGHRHIGPPIKFENEPPQPRTTVPALGADSDAIAAEAGLSEEEIAMLKSEGVI